MRAVLQSRTVGVLFAVAVCATLLAFIFVERGEIAPSEIFELETWKELAAANISRENI